MDEVKIVGIGGYPRSGKDSLGELFIEQGYYAVSFGDIVRDHARKRHVDKADPISVEHMTETSNWLRETHGPDVLLNQALGRYQAEIKAGKTYAGLLFISVRAPIEVDFIKNKHGVLIWVEASSEVRHARNNAHLREGEVPIALDEFIRQEQLQSAPQPNKPVEIQMNMEYVKQQATVTLDNNGEDFDGFKAMAAGLVASI